MSGNIEPSIIKSIILISNSKNIEYIVNPINI